MLDSYCVSLELAYRGILVEQTAGANDVESNVFEQICEFIRQALVSLEEIKELQELPSLQNFPSVASTYVGRLPFLFARERISYV